MFQTTISEILQNLLIYREEYAISEWSFMYLNLNYGILSINSTVYYVHQKSSLSEDMRVVSKCGKMALLPK